MRSDVACCHACSNFAPCSGGTVAGIPNGSVLDSTLDAIPLHRIGEPAEFGRAAAFVLSPAASYVTGTMLPVDGGALRAI